jgi:membrane protease YdiL (CAAX protease family)
LFVDSLIDAETVERPRVWAIVIAAFIGFLAGQILGSLFELIGASLAHYPGGLSALANSNTPPWWANALGLIGLWIGFGAAIYYAYTLGNLRPLPSQWRVRPSDVYYVGLGVACQFLVDFVYIPFHLKHLNRPVHHLFGSVFGASFVLLIVMTTFLAPIMEEWLFRGVLFRALSEGGRWAGTRAGVVFAVVLSAALFALAHGEPLQFAGLFFLGLVLATLVWRTKRLVPSIVTHMSFNGVAIAALISQRSGH